MYWAWFQILPGYFEIQEWVFGIVEKFGVEEPEMLLDAVDIP
jgi:hypothetical protein